MMVEYGTYTSEQSAKRTLLKAAPPLAEHRASIAGDVRLIESSPGFEPAGSMARHTHGYYAVQYDYASGGTGGQRFLLTDDGLRQARERFTKLTGMPS